MRYIAALLIVLSLHAACLGITTQRFTLDTARDFLSGELENIAVSYKGYLRLSPRLARLADCDQLYAWCLVEDSKGNIYVGTGDDGKILKIDLKGEISTFFDSTEVQILSLAIGKDKAIYAGSAPGGYVYRIEPGGVAQTYFASGENYIWSLAFDEDGILYAGSGPSGKVFRITQKGSGSLYYKSPSQHIMTLLWHKGKLYAGGASPGTLYRIASRYKAVALWDTNLEEVHNLIADKGGAIYFSANPEGAVRITVRKKKAGAEAKKEVEVSYQDKEESKSSVFKLHEDGYIKRIAWNIDPPIMGMAIKDGLIYLSSGDEGMVHGIIPHDELFYVYVNQHYAITAMETDSKGRLLIGSSNPAAIYRTTDGYSEKGTYLSKVFSAECQARWGALNYLAELPGDCNITFQLRQGNTAKPDKTWSDWHPAKPLRDNVKATADRALYLQLRAMLSTRDSKLTPRIDSISVSYMHPNREPRISSVTVYPQSKGMYDEHGREAPGESFVQKIDDSLEVRYVIKGKHKEASKGTWISLRGMRTVGWKAKDPDGDKLRFSIYIKGSKESSWRLLKDDYLGQFYSFDSYSFTDGRYIIKVIADDSKDNPLNMGLQAEKLSEVFVIDNTSPTVNILSHKREGNSYIINFEAVDQLSMIKGATISLDGDDWMPVLPVDSICDQASERFQITVEPTGKGKHYLAIKVVDENENCQLIELGFDF